MLRIVGRALRGFRRLLRRLAGPLAEFPPDLELHSRRKRQSRPHGRDRSKRLQWAIRARAWFRPQLLGSRTTGRFFLAGRLRLDSRPLRPPVEKLARDPASTGPAEA